MRLSLRSTEVRGPKAARIYAEEISRRGARVSLAFVEPATKVEASTTLDAQNQQPAHSVSQEPVSKDEQEVIVLRGGFTKW